VLIVGVSPLADLKISGSGSLAAGLLGEFSPGHEPGGPDCWSTPDFPCPDHAPVLSWGVGIWGGNHDNQGAPIGLGVYHEFQSYTHRPTGTLHEQPLSDNRYETPEEVRWRGYRARLAAIDGKSNGREGDSAFLEDLWNQAGSRVQWRAAS
jgi:hypothetical protein